MTAARAPATAASPATSLSCFDARFRRDRGHQVICHEGGQCVSRIEPFVARERALRGVPKRQTNELTPRSWLRFGLHQTPWLDFEESINRYRVQGRMFAEREGIIPGLSDFGVGYLSRFPGNYGEINVGVYNGEGFARGEMDKRKSVQVRATIRPLPKGGVVSGLRFSGFHDAGSFGEDRPRRHGIGMVSYEHPHFVGTAEWLAGTRRPAPLAANADFRGYSLFAEVREGMQGWAGLARFENFDPDRRIGDNSHQRAIAGVAYWLRWTSVRIGLVLTDEDVRYDAGAARANENRLLFQTHVQF